jgi:hypothetical protein
MDSLITAAARALATGDPLGALKRISLRNDAPALALRGIAMAQLGDLTRARSLLRDATRAFSPKESVARARCVVAEAEVALAARDLNWPEKALDSARVTLEELGDHANAAHARYLAIRHLLLLGKLDDAERKLTGVDPVALPPAARAIHSLIAGGIAMRRLQAKAARTSLGLAGSAAQKANIPALIAEVASAQATLDAPAARLFARGEQRVLRLDEVEALFASKDLVIDACRYIVRDASNTISLARRPVLFVLAGALAEAWPHDAPREVLIARAFRGKAADESYRARLRVEIGRLRKALRPVADVNATPRGFVLAPHNRRDVVVLARPIDEEHAEVLALLADGESWSSSGLALALGTSQRTVQRALDALAATGKAQALGRGRARRWTTPPAPGFATTLLLPAPPPV